MRHFIFLAGCVVFLLTTCSNGLETVETVDDFGHVIKYSRSKKDYSREGLYLKTYKEGQKYEEAYYKNNQLHGERKLYFENGKLEILETYENGNFSGPYKTYYENGQLNQEGQYLNNEGLGIWKRYYESGELMEEVTMKGNNENGPFTEYYKNGNKKTAGFYLDGDHEDGELLMYDETGELAKKMDCKRGVCHTVWEKENTGEAPDNPRQ